MTTTVKWKPVFAIVPRRNQTSSKNKDYWYRIGTAFVNTDGSLNIELAGTPRDGRLQVREHDNKFADRKPHPLDPVDGDPFESFPDQPPVMQ